MQVLQNAHIRKTLVNIIIKKNIVKNISKTYTYMKHKLYKRNIEFKVHFFIFLLFLLFFRGIGFGT